MLAKLNRQLFRLARSDVAAYFMGAAFAYFSFLIPVRKIVNTDVVISFEHPRKFWAAHFLVVPKKVMPNVLALDLDSAEHQRLIQHIMLGAAATAQRAQLSDYLILVNGGSFQDVPQLHFHVAAGRDENGVEAAFDWALSAADFAPLEIESVHWLGFVRSAETPTNMMEIRFVARSLFTFDSGLEQLTELFQLSQSIVAEKTFEGFSIATYCMGEGSDELPQFRIMGRLVN